MKRYRKSLRKIAYVFWIHFWGATFFFGLIYIGHSVYASVPKKKPVPVVGVDKDGVTITKMVPFVEYRDTMAAVFSSVRDSIEPALTDQSKIQFAGARMWSLQTIGVGIGLTGSFGLGPIWNLTGFGRIRLIFSSSANPIYPD